MISLASRARRAKRQSPPPPGAWEQLSFVWPVAPPKRPPPKLTVLPPERPQTRADCLPGGWNAQRPCPYAGCKYHLYLQVTEDGDIQINHKGKEPWELEHSCVLDAVEDGPLTLEETGDRIDVSYEYVRTLEGIALSELRRSDIDRELLDGFGIAGNENVAPVSAHDAQEGLRDSIRRVLAREGKTIAETITALGADGTLQDRLIRDQVNHLVGSGELVQIGGRVGADGKRRGAKLWLRSVVEQSVRVQVTDRGIEMFAAQAIGLWLFSVANYSHSGEAK